MAVSLSALLFLILGVVQFGIVFWSWNSMLLAVEEAGRYAMLFNQYPGTVTSGAGANNPPGCAKKLSDCAVDWANQNLGGNFTVTCSSGCAAGSTTMTFKADYTFNFITSFSLSRAVQVPVL
jgi:Flp pilus assembly protein TadG